jgi:hypothetical protein
MPLEEAFNISAAYTVKLPCQLAGVFEPLATILAFETYDTLGAAKILERRFSR